MRDLTPEEKELIVNTEITPDCFEKWEDYHYEEIKLEHFPHPRIEGQFCTIALYPTSCFESMARDCEAVRRKYLQTKNEHYFDILVRLLPNSYKVVNLCAERKDICKAKQTLKQALIEILITVVSTVIATEAEKAQLEERAKIAGLSVSKYIHKLLFSAQ